MECRIELGSDAVRDLRRLEKSDKKLLLQISHEIDSLAKSPLAGKRLKGELRGNYLLRHGDYRIIYRVYVAEKVVLIIRIGHSRDVYR